MSSPTNNNETIAPDSDDDYEDEDVNYWCHQCEVTPTILKYLSFLSFSLKAEIDAILDSGTPTCPRCGSEFVEEMEGGGINDVDDDFLGTPTLNLGGDRADIANVLQMLFQTLQPSLGNSVNMQRLGPNSAAFSVTTEPPNTAQNVPSASDNAQGLDDAEIPAGGVGEPEPNTGPMLGDGVPPEINNLLQLLLNIPRTTTTAGGVPNPFMTMLNMVGNPGGLDDIITELMEQAQQRSAPPAATEEMINKLPSISITHEMLDRKADCTVCQDEFTQDSSALELPCHHIFHTDCIQQWLKMNGSCPVCRFSLVTGTTPQNTENTQVNTVAEETGGNENLDID
ncbi:hypothetical protein HK098_005903 [Nowakowskiella sp. JEL0407]|nr:hypothetical protein HK098_005903 [Nowakowskiella sp. JEL0407]